MRGAKPKRRKIGAIAGVVVALGVMGWLGDALCAIPIEFSDNATTWADGVVVTQREAESFVERAADDFGGLPHDAHVAETSVERKFVVEPRAPSSQPATTGLTLTYLPWNATSFQDHVIARVVVAGIVRRCLDSGRSTIVTAFPAIRPPACRRFVDSPELQLTGFIRAWRPWPERAAALLWERAFGRRTRPPGSVAGACPRPDIDAVRRVVAAASGYSGAMGLRLDRPHTERLWRYGANAPSSVVASWSRATAPVVTTPSGARLPPIRSAAIRDGVQRFLALRFWDPISPLGATVLPFASDDEESVCGGLPLAIEAAGST